MVAPSWTLLATNTLKQNNLWLYFCRTPSYRQIMISCFSAHQPLVILHCLASHSHLHDAQHVPRRRIRKQSARTHKTCNTRRRAKPPSIHWDPDPTINRRKTCPVEKEGNPPTPLKTTDSRQITTNYSVKSASGQLLPASAVQLKIRHSSIKGLLPCLYECMMQVYFNSLV